MNTFVLVTLCFFSFHVVCTNSAFLQPRVFNPCSTADIKAERDRLAQDLKAIKEACIKSKKAVLYGLLQSIVAKASGLDNGVLSCVQEVASRIKSAMDLLKDLLDLSCDRDFKKKSAELFDTILSEIENCIKYNKNCCVCRKSCCQEMRDKYYTNIDAKIAKLKADYKECVDGTCKLINSDISDIQAIIDNCNPPPTTTTTPAPTTDVTEDIEECVDTTTPFDDTTTTTPYIDTTSTTPFVDTTTSTTANPDTVTITWNPPTTTEPPTVTQTRTTACGITQP